MHPFYEVCLYCPIENHLGFFSLSFFNQVSDRLNRLKQAAQYFLIQIIEDGSWVGMVHFNSQATTKSELIQIKGEAERSQLRELLPSSARGGTSICSGIQRAFEVKIYGKCILFSVLLLGPFFVKCYCSYLPPHFDINNLKRLGTKHTPKKRNFDICYLSTWKDQKFKMIFGSII